MKKIVIVAMAVMAAGALTARPHGGFRPPPPMHHGGYHHHHHGGFAAGVIGGALLGGLVYDAIRPAPVVVTPAPVIMPTPVVQPVVVQQPVAQPVVVQQPVVQPVVVQQPVVQQTVVAPAPQPVYQTQNVWVEGRYVDQLQADGTAVRVWQPGHYEQRTVQVN